MPYTQQGIPWAPQSETSHDAAIQAKSWACQQGLDVLAWFQGAGPEGGTQKEASAALNIGRPSIAARVHALEAAGKLVKSRELRRGGCAVYFAR